MSPLTSHKAEVARHSHSVSGVVFVGRGGGRGRGVALRALAARCRAAATTSLRRRCFRGRVPAKPKPVLHSRLNYPDSMFSGRNFATTYAHETYTLNRRKTATLAHTHAHAHTSARATEQDLTMQAGRLPSEFTHERPFFKTTPQKLTAARKYLYGNLLGGTTSRSLGRR